MSKPPERLPAMNYSILKEGILRRKFRELGIPDWGPRPLLQRRHTEWMNLWNANCDSKTPKSKGELLQELSVWERTQGGGIPASFIGSANSAMSKNFNGAQWSARHDGDFKQLIASARQRRECIIPTAVPQASSAQDPPDTSKPEQQYEATGVLQRPVERPVDTAGINNIENGGHAYQNTGDNPTDQCPSNMALNPHPCHQIANDNSANQPPSNMIPGPNLHGGTFPL